MQLHFTKEPVADSVNSDFNNLNKVTDEPFHCLIEILFQFLLESKETERFMQQLTELAGEHGMGVGPLRNLMRSVLLVAQGALKKNLPAESFKQDLITLGLSDHKASHFALKWAEHQAALCRQVIGRTLTVNQLVDMEWKFGVTVGTSEMKKMGNIFLQLKLVVRRGNSTENIYMELTLPQFYNFLHQMERAKASMDCFS